MCTSPNLLLGVMLCSFLSLSTNAQLVVQVGDSLTTNSPVSYPCPYGNDSDDSRHQMLIRADEMTAAGMSAGDISAMAMNVAVSNSQQLFNYEIRMGLTNDTILGIDWIAGLSNVWGPNNFINQSGWNLHNFGTPFFWDGVSNLVIQTCNNNQNNSTNPVMVQTTTTFTSSIWRLTNSGNICNGAGALDPPQSQATARPIFRFTFTPLVAAPISDFSPQNVSSCSNTIQFQDLSAFDPLTWFWDFGDGNTDTVQNPSHTYAVDGTYDVTLITTNTFGEDTLVVPGAVTVNGSSPQPTGACIPSTTASLGGFGIIEFSYLSTTVNSADGQTENFADRACLLDTVTEGSLLDISVVTGGAAPHNVRTWIDWDNSGSFSASELVISDNSVFTATANITVPSTAVQNTPLRIRTIADFQLSPFPTPCGNPQYGQAEDYGIVVVPNSQPPTSGFSVSPTVTCDGQVQFLDESLNAPNVWIWDFGDGNSANSPNPSHTYTSNGTYSVTLITFNTFGSDTLVQSNLITVNLGGAVAPAVCTPATQSILGDYGIYNVSYGSINNSTDGAIDGYQDYSCEFSNTVLEGTPVPISISTGIQNAHDIHVWVDLDNNGDLSSTELIWSELGVTNPSGTLSIPFGAVYNTPLRMRIAADAQGASSASCDQPDFGQVEDYAVVVQQNTAAPVAFFSSDRTSVCLGDSVQFLDQSQNLPTGWTWDFGDGNTSSVQDPYHTYLAAGSYNVTLTATNPNGSDAITQTNYIEVVDSLICDTFALFFGGQTTNSCGGVVTDDGGANGDYSFFGQGTFTIAPTSGDVVILQFSQFNIRPQDELIIYDGPTNFSPVIGTYSGNTLPNGGTIISTGPAITFTLIINGGPGGNFTDGFIATWECGFNSVAELDESNVILYPNPSSETVTIALSKPGHVVEAVIMYDLLGKVVIENPINGSRSMSTMDIRSLPSGRYMVSVITNGQVITLPLMVN